MARVRARLIWMQDHGTVVPLFLCGAALVGCPVLLLVAASRVGESWQLVAAAFAVLLFAMGLCGLRQQATGVGLPILMAAVITIGITAEVVGTLWEVSGVAIGVPLVAAFALVSPRAGGAWGTSA